MQLSTPFPRAQPTQDPCSHLPAPAPSSIPTEGTRPRTLHPQSPRPPPLPSTDAPEMAPVVPQLLSQPKPVQGAARGFKPN